MQQPLRAACDLRHNYVTEGAAETSKILGIELLRFASALAVLVFHYQHFAFIGTTQQNFVASDQPLYPWLSLFYNQGFYGVEVFWCISGFIFFWKYGRAIADNHLGGFVFFVLRLSRLYPLHFATLLFMAAMQLVYFSMHGNYFVYHYNDPYHFALQLFMASNWGFQAGDSFNGPIWSISIEVIVYAVFFLLLRYLSGSAWLVATLALVAAAVQVLKVSAHPLFTCLMFFFLGCLTAIVYESANKRARARTWISVASVLAVLTLIVTSLFVAIKAKYFLIIFSPALIFLCVTHVPESRLASKILIPAGNVTYASYLLHVPIQIAVVSYCDYTHTAIPFFNPAFFLSFIGFTLLLSHWTYEWFEMPAQRVIRRKLLPTLRGASG